MAKSGEKKAAMQRSGARLLLSDDVLNNMKWNLQQQPCNLRWISMLLKQVKGILGHVGSRIQVCIREH